MNAAWKRYVLLPDHRLQEMVARKFMAFEGGSGKYDLQSTNGVI
jgi:hypothetical protein